MIIFVDHFYAASQFPMEKSREEVSMISSPPNKYFFYMFIDNCHWSWIEYLVLIETRP